MTKSNLGKSLSYISWVTVHTGEAMDEYYLLACSPHLAQSAFLHYQDHLPKGSNSIHSELGPPTAVIMLRTLNTFCSPKFQNVSCVVVYKVLHKCPRALRITAQWKSTGYASTFPWALFPSTLPWALFPALQKLKTCKSHWRVNHSHFEILLKILQEIQEI